MADIPASLHKKVRVTCQFDPRNLTASIALRPCREYYSRAV